MKNIFVLLLAICIVSICVPVMAQITDLHKIRVTENIPYSQTVRIGATKTIKLCFDLYEPISDFDFDANIKRPLIIAVYGGAFVIGIGSRKNTDISTYCTNFAQLGYVAASIDYSNMSPFHISSKNLIRSAYKAVQDLSTAIRYFKANSEQYKIDTSNIFLVGSSSGSIVILHELFMKEDERPLEVFYEPYLGDIHTKGDTSLLKYSTDVRGAVVQWTGILDTCMIDLDELERNNLCLLHCKNDPIVPYNYGACFSIERLPHVYGSNLIVKRMNNLGFHNYNFFSFDIIAHAYYYDIVYGIGIDHQKFEDCFRISYDFIERHIYKPDSD